MNYNDVEPASEARIAHIKEVAQTTEPYSWSNYDVLSLIKVIEKYESDSEWEAVTGAHNLIPSYEAEIQQLKELLNECGECFREINLRHRLFGKQTSHENTTEQSAKMLKKIFDMQNPVQ